MVIRRLATSIRATDVLEFRLHFITANNSQVTLGQMAKARVFLLSRDKIGELVRKVAMVGFNPDRVKSSQSQNLVKRQKEDHIFKQIYGQQKA